MCDVAQVTGVSVSTLHRWARENGWRLEDIAARGPVGSGGSGGSGGSVENREEEEAMPADPHPDETQDLQRLPGFGAVGPGMNPGKNDENEHGIPTPAEAADAAFALAAQAFAEGNFPRAERVARLALRFRQIAGAGGKPETAPEAEAVEEVDPRIELMERYERIAEFKRREAERAAAAEAEAPPPSFRRKPG